MGIKKPTPEERVKGLGASLHFYINHLKKGFIEGENEKGMKTRFREFAKVAMEFRDALGIKTEIKKRGAS